MSFGMFLDEWMIPNFIIELLTAAFLVAMPLKKKIHFWRKTGSFFTAIILLHALRIAIQCFILKAVENDMIYMWAAEFNSYWLMIASSFVFITMHVCICILYLRWTCDINFSDAIYGAFIAYAVQHSMYMIQRFILYIVEGTGFNWVISARYIAILIAVYGIEYFLFLRHVGVGGEFNVRLQDSVFVVGIVMYVAIGLSIFGGVNTVPLQHNSLFPIVCLYGFTCCIFMLIMQVHARRELYIQNQYLTEKWLWREQKKQYDLSRENIELINQKCHDIRHQIQALKYMHDSVENQKAIDEIQNMVVIYDSRMKTGSEALDVLLQEKALNAKEKNVTLTCMVDGEELSFIAPIDLYTLIGNAIDNAIRAVSEVINQNKKVITVTSSRQGNMLLLEITNYFHSPIQLEDGFPKTNRDGRYHGYGMKSIRRIVEKYEGAVQCYIENDIFTLAIMLPLKVTDGDKK